jgi:hypothetical protein
MKKSINNIGIDIFPDYNKEIERSILRFKNKFKINLIFNFNNGVTIEYESEKYTPIKGIGKGDIVFLDSTGCPFIYFIETWTSLEFRLMKDDTILLEIPKNND